MPTYPPIVAVPDPTGPTTRSPDEVIGELGLLGWDARILEPSGPVDAPGLLAKLSEATKLLLELQWGPERTMGHGEGTDRSCPICGGLKIRGGHASTCRLVTFLKTV
jgi:hypothetical protein